VSGGTAGGDASFWRARWREGRTGFHEGRPNSFLEQFASRLDGHQRVLVPLCGKSADLAYLASRGHRVVGAELVADAVEAFFAEHQLTPRVVPHADLTEYITESITIYAGDFFALDRARLGPIDAIYDRAAIIALPESLRRRYVDHLIDLARPRLRALTVTLVYDQAQMPGPPYSVTDEELARLYHGFTVEPLAEGSETSQAFPMTGRCFLVTG